MLLKGRPHRAAPTKHHHPGCDRRLAIPRLDRCHAIPRPGDGGCPGTVTEPYPALRGVCGENVEGNSFQEIILEAVYLARQFQYWGYCSWVICFAKKLATYLITVPLFLVRNPVWYYEPICRHYGKGLNS